MCFSKTTKENIQMAQVPLDLRVSDEFENNCDYIKLDSRKELVSDNRSLTLIQLNIRGLTSKTSVLNQLLSENMGKIRPDTVLLCETWLNSINLAKIDIPNYRLFGNVRSRERKDLEIESKTFEHTVVKLKNSNIKLTVGIDHNLDFL